MIRVEEYQRITQTGVEALPCEEVKVGAAAGRVLAEDLRSIHPVPPFTNSAMDGFAVCTDDVVAGAVLPVTADVPAGRIAPEPLWPGTAQRIMTGAPIPPGANAVVPVEDTDQPSGSAPLPKRVRIDAAPTPNRHVRYKGEDVPAGTVVIRAGTRLTPAALAAAISVGHATVPVRRRPRVAIISTGAELRRAGEKLGPGEIPDSNGPLLTELVREAGGEVVTRVTTGDDSEEFAAALDSAMAADLVVTSGGASAGAFDVVKHVAEPLGVEFRSVAMQPGKPQGHGRLIGDGGRRVPVFALPGNPVSVFVSFHALVRPVLELMLGTSARAPIVTARATSGWRCPAGRRQYTPVLVSFGAEVTCEKVHPLGSGSHLVASLPHANGLAIAAEDATEVQAGDLLEVHLVNLPWR
ncbi:MAG TPA: gephyrin-like molybdotransferase Glp [Actinomycetaceae bacterium]|nr:gephyrin-like molybdotransferase Glp [Actinomycetaceae bacterium]